MDLQKAQDLCLQLMNKHGLTKANGWTFEWIRSKHAAGMCKRKSRYDYSTHKREYFDQKICLSKFVTNIHSEEKVINTILHEIAHGLTPGHKHDYVWRSKAIEIGCDGERCYEACDEHKNQLKQLAKFVGTCPLCNRKWHQSRMPKIDQWCKCAGRKFNQDEKIVYVQNSATKTISKPTPTIPKVRTSGIVSPGAQRPDPYKGMLDKFEREFLPLINNDKALFKQITHQALQNNSWRTQNREVRKACNKYMFDNKLMTNQKFQEMFFYEGPMNGRTTHGTKAPWITGRAS